MRLFSAFFITMSLFVSLQFNAIETKAKPAKEKEQKQAQLGKRNFTFEDAMKFESIRFPKISNNAKWFAFEAKQDRGDITGYINSTEDTTQFKVKSGSGIMFSNSSEWAAMAIVPSQMESENAKTPKEKPNNSLKIINLSTKEEKDIDNLQSFRFSEDSRWIAYKLKDDEALKPKMDKFKDKILGSALKLRHLNSGTEISIDWVTEFKFDTNSNYIFYAVSEPKGKKDGIYCRELTREYAPEKTIMNKVNWFFGGFDWNKQKNMLAFLADSLNEKGKADFCGLYFWSSTNNENKLIIADSAATKDWYLPSTNPVKWNKTGDLLYFGLKPKNQKIDEKDPIKFKDTTFYNRDTLLAKAEVYVWHWDDPLIVTQQQSKWRKEKDKIYYAVYNLNTNNYLQLADTLIADVEISSNNEFALIYTDVPYRKEQTWVGDQEDIYCVNLQTGEKKKVVEKIQENASMSFSGNYVVYYKDKHWNLYNSKTGTSTNVTQNINTQFNSIFQDIPTVPQSCGFAGWIDDEKGFLLYDNYDIWYFDIANINNPRMITKGNDKTNKIKYTLKRIDYDDDYFSSNDTLIITGFSKQSKQMGYFSAVLNGDKFDIKIPMDVQFFRAIRKAKDVPKIIFTQEKYDIFPNYWLSDLDFSSPKRISNLNIAIKDTFNWGTTELVEWKYQDTTLQGYLIKPDNYDPKKKYPMFVYFYDQMSDRMNAFYMPELTHRPVNHIYMDNYIMFFPDIKYGVGSPGNDALQSILSGCRYLAEKGIIDSTKSCIQGHSWGAYQTAYIITQTNYFAAACAGAPVGNMTSAYSGIRLESGRTRQFQYETQQSRIGGNLWDSLDAYIRNSPVFFANKVKTPFLIGFGDVDEAVPWQQGVELYMALRRAQSPTIMLQYVNEPHWVGRYWNKVDYSVKMKEFFDHYILGKPAPAWIIEGKKYKGETYK